jgi:hypothetical protein
MSKLLRRCEQGGNGQKRACCLFGRWAAARSKRPQSSAGETCSLLPCGTASSISLWLFDGDLPSLLKPGNVVIAKTYPAECCRWFSKAPLGGKRNSENRKNFGASLLDWAGSHQVTLANLLTEDIQRDFPQGDRAFDAVLGLLGMLKMCLGEREPGEPEEQVIPDIEGWILGRKY